MEPLKYFQIIYLMCLFSFSTMTALGADLAITGSAKFKQQVDKALSLLKSKAPEEYAIVIKYVGKIEQGKRSGIWAYKNPPTYTMSDKTAFYSITWCAGTIAHDSYHSKLYHDYMTKHGLPVPNNEWGGETAEKKCLVHQVKTLKKIGAPESEITYCMKINPNFPDLNKDGKYDWDDYEKRDW